MRKALFLLWILVCTFAAVGQIVAKGSKLLKRENHPVSPERLPPLLRKEGSFQGMLYASGATLVRQENHPVSPERLPPLLRKEGSFQGMLYASGATLARQENHPVSPERLPPLLRKEGSFQGQGALYASDAKGVQLGACPLKNTAVNVEISGFVARVRVVQDFTNTFNEPIEAVYIFPLSQNSAVDDMTMTVGTRVIRGKVLKREEARQVYESAKTEGKTASLLDQERTNVFTQSVANIMPGESVKIEISYVETLKYEDGEYEFVFPMTVGPRYIPGSVTDAAKISPPIATTRAGHDISINVNLNAGVPVEGVRSSSHGIDQLNYSPTVAKVNLKGETTIPNKDFVLRYDVTGKRIEDALIAHRGGRGGFFTLVLQPPDKIASEDRTPKEIVFVLDTSGSMDGFPIEKAKEAMKLSLDGLYPEDTFNLITFAGDTHVLFDAPVPATQANLELAQEFLASRSGGGGTEMMKAIKTALAPSGSKEHLRIVCFMTDGYVGNEDEIVAEIQRNPQARVFSFGIGNSVNRALLDKMAEAGKGEVEYVSLEDDGSKAAKRFYERVRSPLLTDLSIEWNGLPVADVYPSKLGDLFSAKPVIVKGRYTKGGRGTIKLRGKVAGQPYERTIGVNLPEAENANDSLASLWARQRIDELSSDALNASKPDAINKQITDLGLEFGLMTKFTSFVAVEERIVNQNGLPVKIEVPVEAPDGVDMEKAGGRWGDPDKYGALKSTGPGTGGGGGGGVTRLNQTQYFPPVTVKEKGQQQLSGRGVSGQGTGAGSGSGSGYGGGSAPPAPTPAPLSGQNGATNALSLSVSETVSVASESPMIDTTSSSISTTIRPDSTGSLIGGAGGGGGRTEKSRKSGNVSSARSDRTKSPVSPPKPKVVSGGVMNGKAIDLPKPAYPPAASAVGASGTVSVQVTINESGKVISANAVSGHPLLRAAARQSALAATFAPTILSGKPAMVTGVITYNFVSPETTSKEPSRIAPGPGVVMLSPEQIREFRLKRTFHTWLYAVVDRVEKNAAASPNESMFVRDGKASVELTFNGKVTPKLLAQLKAAGFEVEKSDKSSAVGTIAVEKLRELADVYEIKYVMPRMF